MLNSEVTDLKACLQKHELQSQLKAQELTEALGKVSTHGFSFNLMFCCNAYRLSITIGVIQL